jgi:hypothetical protein
LIQKSSILRGVKDYPIYSKNLDPSKREREINKDGF